MVVRTDSGRVFRKGFGKSYEPKTLEWERNAAVFSPAPIGAFGHGDGVDHSRGGRKR